MNLVSEMELTVLLPCLNESETLGICIAKAKAAIEQNHLNAEIVVADNGSTDGSQQIAREAGARVVDVPRRGYGSALLAGIAAAQGTYIIMADSDDSYDLAVIMPFLNKLREGFDLVMGNRFKGEIALGAMPFLHRYLGTPVLTFISRIFFHTPCGDVNCGMRGFRKQSAEMLALRSTGMEFASEMLVKASLFRLRIAEIPTRLSRDGRSTPPHLRTWHDGWRHVRFLLLYSPRWLFLYPGIALMFLGAAVTVWLLPGPRFIGRIGFDVHTLLFAGMTILIGFQSILFATFSKVFAITEGLLPEDIRFNRLFKYVNLELGLLMGLLLLLAGTATWAIGLEFWGSRHFGPLNPEHTLRIVIPGVVMFTLGLQVILASFFLSLMGMSRR
jgi:glycosyltransferase involved in cell wall biosynthesis